MFRGSTAVTIATSFCVRSPSAIAAMAVNCAVVIPCSVRRAAHALSARRPSVANRKLAPWRYLTLLELFIFYVYMTSLKIPTGHNTINPFAIVPDSVSFIHFVETVFDGREAAHVRTPDRDGSIIHAEVMVGDATIMLCDRKQDWPFTPALLQVYVPDAQACLDRAVKEGGRVVTPISDFYGGYRLARLLDPWQNLWWLYEPTAQPLSQDERDSDTEWHDNKPSTVYSTLMEAMCSLGER